MPQITTQSTWPSRADRAAQRSPPVPMVKPVQERLVQKLSNWLE